MKYMGSKRRIAKHILPIMVGVAQERGVTKWVEPFVGGGNMIDKVPPSFERIGYDLNEHAIMAMIDIRDRAADLPDSVTEQEYNDMKGLPAASVTSWVRFGASFGGKFEGGFARGKNNTGGSRNYTCETKRNALKQQPLLQGVQFTHGCYQDLDVSNALIYCDPPYANTAGYKTGDFDSEAFFLAGVVRKLQKVTLYLLASITRLLILSVCGKVRLKPILQVVAPQRHTMRLSGFLW